ncbi:Liprin-beta-1 [Ophiophagus hannah]|uniref:Liprin-beta-1 n=1 Tax=Ophiophagus hannah TaxID=8665 RepID=V8NK84_OPHHA|nr:Liprin-beta-1 [Ophiophagus hannah]
MTMMGDASEMLAAALEQMDGIIAGSKALEYSNGLFDCQSPTSPFMGSFRVLHLVEDLRGLLEMMEMDEKEGLRSQVPDSTAEVLMEWLQNQMINGHLSANGDVYQERLTRLESDKESLVLQVSVKNVLSLVSVLTDQVDAQGEKIRDLELCLEENREKLNSTEEMLQQELLSRTSLETQKLDLMAEVSNLKLKLTAVEKDRMDYEDRFGDADDLMQEVNDLRLKVGEMDRERLHLFSSYIFTSLSILCPSCQSLMAKLSSMKIKVSQMQYEKQRMEQKCQMLKEELLSLKEKLEQKESEIKRLHEKLVLQVKEDIDINDKDPNFNFCLLIFLTIRSKSSALQKSSSLGNLKKDASEDKESRDKLAELTCSFFFPPTNQNKSPVENSKYVTLPCKSPGEEEAFGSRKARSSFGRGFFKIKSNKRTASAPNLAETEKESPDHLDLAGFPRPSKGAEGGPLTPLSPDSKKKARGIKKLFGRLRRSQSTTFNPDDMTDTEFKRGGTRATAGPRLGWSRDLGQSNNDLDMPFAKWRKEQDDLLSLKVLSVLHHLSIKRAIQVLRMNNFEPNCLRRRPSDENNITPSEVSQWTNHRVMEWLRSVDLAEYAPNLRGSGVHGGLMVLEPRFNVETLAQLLNIPPNKTLLRRHLATHFNLLVGSEAQQEKREAMEGPDYVLLTATAKVKPKKLAFSNFGNLRKKKQDDGGEEYVCPMDLGQVAGTGSKKGFKPGLDNRVYDDDDLDRLEQVFWVKTERFVMEDSEGTVRQIGAFSEGINNLTGKAELSGVMTDVLKQSEIKRHKSREDPYMLHPSPNVYNRGT